MGYTIIIGERVDHIEEEEVYAIAEEVALEIDRESGFEKEHYCNSRHPSYTQWDEFCEKLGIKYLMFGEQNLGQFYSGIHNQYLPSLIRPTGSFTPINSKHLEVIDFKVREYKKKFPDHLPRYPLLKPGREPSLDPNDYETDPKYDGVLVRAEWLLFWVRWSLNNCTRPIFYHFG